MELNASATTIFSTPLKIPVFHAEMQTASIVRIARVSSIKQSAPCVKASQIPRFAAVNAKIISFHLKLVSVLFVWKPLKEAATTIYALNTNSTTANASTAKPHSIIHNAHVRAITSIQKKKSALSAQKRLNSFARIHVLAMDFWMIFAKHAHRAQMLHSATNARDFITTINNPFACNVLKPLRQNATITVLTLPSYFTKTPLSYKQQIAAILVSALHATMFPANFTVSNARGTSLSSQSKAASSAILPIKLSAESASIISISTLPASTA